MNGIDKNTTVVKIEAQSRVRIHRIVVQSVGAKSVAIAIETNCFIVGVYSPPLCPTQITAAVWPNGEGIGFRSRGLQVRVLSRSTFFVSEFSLVSVR